MNFVAVPEDVQSIKSSSQSFVSSTAATTKSTSNGNAKNLIGQLVRRILVISKVSPSEWPMKESLLMSMSENILSSSLKALMPTSNSNSPAILESCQKRLKSTDPSLQTAIRFSALATAFLGANGQFYGNVRVTGGEACTRKAALVYFLLRVAEKTSKPFKDNKTIFEMVKRPEIEEASKSATLNQINSRIQSVLSNTPSSKETKSEPARNEFKNFNSELKESRNYNDIQNQATIQTAQSVWEQFEAMKRQDCGGVSEEGFLRDLIYVLQGLEGNLLLFSESEGRYVVNGRIRVARPIRSLVEKLGKIGTDYRYLQNQVGVHRENAGVLRQSFCRAMAQELAEYLKLVAYLESSLNEKEGSEGSMSLKKVVYWFHEAGILLNFLRELVRDTANLRGGAFLSFLEQFRQHGNDQIRAVITRILDQMMLPYVEMLQGWLREGIINDPFDEFFISEVSRSSRSFEFDGSDFWNQKYVLKMSELPKLIPEKLAKRALIAGKTRKFIKAFLKNPPTHLRYQNNAALNIQSDRDSFSSAVLRENLLESMEKEMKLAYKNACKQVRRILIEDCQLIEQFRCIKQYVLLCKGDFSMNLLELLWDGLNRPAGSLFRHNLVGVLESSIECTRDQKEPDWLLANLDVRLLSNDQISGSSATGWDVFALDYRVSFPVDCILDPQSMQEYSKLSRYIWGLKRLETVLSRCWQNLRNSQVSVSKVVKKELRSDLRKMELLQYEMISFVRQALSVCFETISGEWDVFETVLNKMSEKNESSSSEEEGVDLDALITAHREFLNNLKTKLRFWSSQAMRSKMAVISLGILRFENVQNALISILQGQSMAPSLNEMRTAFQSSARHFQTDLDDLLMTLQKESALNNSEDLFPNWDITGGKSAPIFLLMPTNYIDGIPVEFPHAAYPCQLTFMEHVLRALKNRENALLESPTGTGKTLSLLCAALAWRTAEMGRKQLMEQTAVSRSANYDIIMERSNFPIPNSATPFQVINSASGSVTRLQNALNESLNYLQNTNKIEDDSSDYSEFIKTPLIIYASRTHSQLSQVIGELRRTNYRPKIAIVGSREQMCIHPNVKELSSSSAQSAVCNRLTRKKACEFNLRVPEALNHLKRDQREKEKDCEEQKIMDMEDLIRFASLHKACPYYTSRELLSEADLVFMPYNYLLDKKTRGSSLLSFKDAIVIFDEAHNVESSCYDAVSCEISSDDLNLSEKELAHCLELVDFMSEFGGVSKDTVIAAQRFVVRLKENMSKFIIPQGTNFLSESGDAIFRVFEDGQQFTNGSDRVEIDTMLGSFEEIVKLYLEDQYNRRSGKRSAFQSLVSALRTIYGMSEKEDEEGAADDPSTCYNKILDRNQKRKELIEKSKSFYRMVISETVPSSYGKQLGNPVSSTGNARTMAYWCFNPGVVMKDLISMGVRSIVLTSGTLSPMKSFMQEMQIDFKHVLENDHVIDDEQVFATVVRTGPSGKSLNSSFNQRDSKEYQQELGLSIVNFCKVIPDGVLVFFPSYQVMDSCLNYWQVCRPGGSSAGHITGAKTIFQMIQDIKISIIEPKNKGELSVAMDRFERIIDDHKESRGAIFFAVCRGKVSEGLDFSDSKGRAVILTGIPYPPFKDPKIILKKQYLQDNQRSSPQGNFLTGTEWYNQQASRAVNQALGRVIRHRKDFGAILLCDERFGNPSTIGQLSKWLRGRVTTSASFGEVQGGLARFFKDKPKNVESKEHSTIPLGLMPSGFNRPQEPQPQKNEIQMQKFKLDQMPFSISNNSTSCGGGSSGSSSLTEMFKSQKTETKKFDWFNSKLTTAATTANVQNNLSNHPTKSEIDMEKQKRAQDYLEFAKKTLPKDNLRNFMGLLKMYRAGQIEIEKLLTDLVEVLDKVEESKGRALLEGFETFIPMKHRNLFEQVLKRKRDENLRGERERERENGFAFDFANDKEIINEVENDEIKKRKLHSDFIGKRPSIGIEPIVLKRKLIGDLLTLDHTKKENIDISSSHESCPICKDSLNDPCKSKCGHVACFDCWNAWLRRTLECPLCRQRTRVSQLRRISEVDE